MEKREGSEVILCGMLSIVKEVTTKKGERMAFLNLEDKEGILEVVVFPEVFSQSRHLLEGDDPRVVMGSIQHDDKASKILANRIMTLEEAQVETVETVHFYLQADRVDREVLARLRHLLVSHPGECKTQLHLTVDRESEAVIALSPKLHINPSRTFFQEVAQHFGPNAAVPAYKACAQC